MPDYYDSWSANNRKKNPNRQHTRGSSARTRRSHHPVLDPSQSSLVSELISPLPLSAPTTAFTHQSTTPSLPLTHQQNTTNSLSTLTGNHSKAGHLILNPRIAVQGWRFSKNFFESSKNTVSYEADFDDVDEEDDDDDLDDEDVGIENEETTNSKILANGQPSSIRVVPRFPSVGFKSHSPSGSTAQPPPSRRSMFWPDFQSRKSTPVQGERDLGHIEQLDNRREDDGASLFQDVPPQELLAQSLPALSNTNSTLLTSDQSSDHPLSTSTFNARLYPPSAPGLDGSLSTRNRSQRPRPWSQVIWESPVLGDPPEQSQQQPHQASRAEYRNSHTVDARLSGAYPALTKDLFTQDAPTPKERVLSKSVRIQIDLDTGPQSTSRQSQTKPHSATGIRSISGGNSNHRGTLNINNNNNSLFPAVSGKREFSHSKKNNRLSLGSGFYASIEPVFLSNATPSTPKTKRNLVRLPARPQSVFIPAGAATGHLGNSQSGTKSTGSTLQPVPIESSKRRRHHSQQLEMRGEPLSVPIPWKHLSTLSANDNARTFHGLGSAPSAPPSVLKKGVSQSTSLDGSTSCSALADTVAEKAASTNPPSRQQMTSPKQILQRNPGSHPHDRYTSSSPPSASFHNSRQSAYTPSKFLPALLESSSSFFFKKPRPAFAISSRSSSRDSTMSDMSDSTSSSSTSSPSRAQGRTNQSPSSSSSSPFRHTLHFQTRKSLPARAPRSRQTLMTSPPLSAHLASSTAAANIQLTTSNNPPVISTTTTTTSSWKRDSSSILFPYSLVSYEIGGVVGGHPRSITHGSSSVLAPGTTIPSGIIVSTEVPQSLLAPHSPILAVPTILFTPSESSAGITDRHQGAYTHDPRAELDDDSESNDGDGDVECKDDNENEEDDDDEEYEGDECFVGEGEDYENEMKGSHQFMQKSHVAVYEINARWGSRLMMVLVTIGGLVSVLGGGLCAEHHCQDLQFCQDNYQAHGNWCGPSGIDGAPYMLTVGLSMCIFGLYSLTYLRVPTSRLVGYSEIDQFL